MSNTASMYLVVPIRNDCQQGFVYAQEANKISFDPILFKKHLFPIIYFYKYESFNKKHFKKQTGKWCRYNVNKGDSANVVREDLQKMLGADVSADKKAKPSAIAVLNYDKTGYYLLREKDSDIKIEADKHIIPNSCTSLFDLYPMNVCLLKYIPNGSNLKKMIDECVETVVNEVSQTVPPPPGPPPPPAPVQPIPPPLSFLDSVRSGVTLAKTIIEKESSAPCVAGSLLNQIQVGFKLKTVTEKSKATTDVDVCVNNLLKSINASRLDYSIANSEGEEVPEPDCLDSEWDD